MTNRMNFLRAAMIAIVAGAATSAAAASLTTGPSLHGGSITGPRLPEVHFRAEGPRHKKFWEKVEGDCVAVQKPPKHRNAASGYLGPATGGHQPHGPKGGYQAPPTDGSGKRGSGQLITECK